MPAKPSWLHSFTVEKVAASDSNIGLLWRPLRIGNVITVKGREQKYKFFRIIGHQLSDGTIYHLFFFFFIPSFRVPFHGYIIPLFSVSFIPVPSARILSFLRECPRFCFAGYQPEKGNRRSECTRNRCLSNHPTKCTFEISRKKDSERKKYLLVGGSFSFPSRFSGIFIDHLR